MVWWNVTKCAIEMAWTQADIDALKAAIVASAGVAEVRYADGSAVRYMAPDQAAKLLQTMQLDVNAAAATVSGSGTTRVRAFRGALSSGY
jgi:hypothetical protein